MEASTERPVVALVTGIGAYHVGVIDGAARVLAERGVPLLVVAVDTFESDRTPEVVLDLLRDPGTRGVIALADAAVFQRADLPVALRGSGLPVVTLGIKFGDFPCVVGDNAAGMKALMVHLLDDCGARRLVLVRGTTGHRDSLERERVFRQECAKRGVAVDEDRVIEGQFRAKPTYDALRQLLSEGVDVDAVVALNDPSAFGALSALTDHGLDVPHDVLLSGFDDIPEARSGWPPLTTVDQRLGEQGAEAAIRLLALIEGRAATDLSVPSRLVVRASTSREDVTTEEILSSARSLQARVTQQELAVQISWDMANCHTLDDVITALEPCLTQIGVRRCFVAITPQPGSSPFEEDGAPGEAVANRTVLVFAFRDGRTDPVTGEVFRRHEVLPSSLHREFDEGPLLLQPISVEGRERGHLLYEINSERHVLTEALRIELPRTLEMVFSSQEMKDHAAVLERLVVRRTRELERVNAELRRSVMRDGLTGIFNRRAFESFLEEAFDPVTGTGRQLALLMIDVDQFKAFNDRYGHLAGDEVLRTVASCLEQAVRSDRDLACRYGGEEFAVILWDSGVEGALALGRRFRDLLAAAAIAHDVSTVASVLTASAGAAAMTVLPGFDPAVLIASADQALYRAKTEGRDRIVVADGAHGSLRGQTRGSGTRRVGGDDADGTQGHARHPRVLPAPRDGDAESLPGPHQAER